MSYARWPLKNHHHPQAKGLGNAGGGLNANTMTYTRATVANGKGRKYLYPAQSGNVRGEGFDTYVNWIDDCTWAQQGSLTNVTKTAKAGKTPSGRWATKMSDTATVGDTFHYSGTSASAVFSDRANRAGQAQYQRAVVKQVTGSGIVWLLSGNSNHFAYFDIINGTTGTDSGAGFAVTSGITDLGDGWFEIWADVREDIGVWSNMSFGIGLSVVDGDPSYDNSSTANTQEILMGDYVSYVYSDQDPVPTFFADRHLNDDGIGLTPVSWGEGSGSGWRLEDTSTNLCHYSELFDSWTKVGTPTVTYEADTDPFGFQEATTITDDDGAAFEYITSNSGTYTTDTWACFSIYLKKDAVAQTTRAPSFRVSFAGGTNQSWDLRADTSTGEVVAVRVGGAAGSAAVGVYDFNEDYWRVYIAAEDGNTSNTTVKVQIFPATNSDAGMTGGQLATLTGSITVFGAMIENNDVKIPSSYLHTPTNATVTRNADFLREDNADDWYQNNTECVWLVEFEDYSHKAGAGRIVSGDSSDVVVAGQGTANGFLTGTQSYNGGVSNNTGTNSLDGAGSPVRILAGLSEAGGWMIAEGKSSWTLNTAQDPLLNDPTSTILLGDTSFDSSFGLLQDVAVSFQTIDEATAVKMVNRVVDAVPIMQAQDSVRHRKRERDKFRRRYRRT